VSSTWRNDWRCTPFLTTLGTYTLSIDRPFIVQDYRNKIYPFIVLTETKSISRSGPLSPTRSTYSPASPLSPWLPAPRHTQTQSCPSDRPIQHQGTTSTPTRTYSSGVCLFSSDGQGVGTSASTSAKGASTSASGAHARSAGVRASASTRAKGADARSAGARASASTSAKGADARSAARRESAYG